MNYKNILYSKYRDEISKFEKLMMKISLCPHCRKLMKFPKYDLYDVGCSRYSHICKHCGFTIDENFMFTPNRFTNDGIDEESLGIHKARIMKVKEIMKKTKNGVGNKHT